MNKRGEILHNSISVVKMREVSSVVVVSKSKDNNSNYCDSL